MSRFVNPNKDTTINIDGVKDTSKEEAKKLHAFFAGGTILEPVLFKRMR